MNNLNNIVDYLKVFNNIETYKTPRSRFMAQGGRIGLDDGGRIAFANGPPGTIKKETGPTKKNVGSTSPVKTDTHIYKRTNRWGTVYSDVDDTEAKKKGWKKRKTINLKDIRKNLVKNKKKVTMINNQFIFANEKLEKEFLDDMILRYKYPKTSTAAKNAGVKSNAQIFETYFKGTYSEKGVHDLINRFKKTLGDDFSRLHPSERDAHKLRRQAKELISQAGKRISGLDDFPAHHLYPIGDEFAHGTQDFTILDKKTNSQLSGSNKQLVALAEERTQLINDVSSGKINPKKFDIEIGKLDKQAQTIINGHYKKFPKHDGLLNWRKATSILDDQGRFMDIQSAGTIGGDSSKWAITDVNKQIKDLSKTELSTFRGDIKNTANDFLKEAGFNIDKCLSEGGRVKLKLGKGVNTCITGVIEAEQKAAQRGSKEALKKFSKFGKAARFAGWFLGPIDLAVELAFAAPHMLQGDREAAKRATTAGLLGWGEKKLDEIKADSPEAYKYAKHVKDNNDWVDAWFSQQDAEQNLEILKNVPEGSQTEKKAIYTNKKNKAMDTMAQIQEGYVGYVDEEGNFDPMGGAKGKTALQDYLREDVKKKADAGFQIDIDLPFYQKKNVAGIAPFKGGQPITNVKQYIEQKNEPYWKSGLEHAAYEAGVPDLYDTFMQGADNKDPRDIYSELPLEYASQLGKMEAEETRRLLAEKKAKEEADEAAERYGPYTRFAEGGIASLNVKR